MQGDSFIDTNIWIYAHLRKPDDPRHSIALQLVETLTDGVISPQVAAEYYSVMLRSGQSDAWIQENLHTMIEFFRVQPLNESVLRLAWKIRNHHGFSIWDSQIVAAALVSNCRILYTEDLQHDQRIESIVIINPLL
jgi:predicted nucleic acid-binding protein